MQNGSANISEETLPALPDERDQAQLLVTKRGYVRLLERRHTVVGTKPGGLYLYDRSGKPKKIWEGYPVVADVSPSGCGIVFVAERQAQTPFGGANDVFEADICKGIPD